MNSGSFFDYEEYASKAMIVLFAPACLRIFWAALMLEPVVQMSSNKI